MAGKSSKVVCSDYNPPSLDPSDLLMDALSDQDEPVVKVTHDILICVAYYSTILTIGLDLYFVEALGLYRTGNP